MLKEQFTKMTWHKKVRDYYINKGYKYTRDKDTFLVKIEDLDPKSLKEIDIICDCCNKEFKQTYKCYINNKNEIEVDYCDECIKIKKAEIRLAKKQDDYYNKVICFCNERGYDLITNKKDIINTNSEIKYICSKHGQYTTKLTSILQGKQCYKCSREIALYKKYSNDLIDRQNKLFEKAISICKDKGYTLKSEKNDITNNTSYIDYICPKHGIHNTRISNLINGKGCPECALEFRSDIFKKDTKDVVSEVLKYGGYLINPEDYVNNSTKNLKISCPKCKTLFITSLRNFTQHGGQVCNNCHKNESIGEYKIRTYLQEQDILFEQEKWFNDCRDVNPLPFDFYLPTKNIIIEFDGRQHFDETEFFSYSLEKVKKHDNIKNEYCNKNNITLIRIPYWDINHINDILNIKLKINSHEDIV